MIGTIWTAKVTDPPTIRERRDMSGGDLLRAYDYECMFVVGGANARGEVVTEETCARRNVLRNEIERRLNMIDTVVGLMTMPRAEGGAMSAIHSDLAEYTRLSIRLDRDVEKYAASESSDVERWKQLRESINARLLAEDEVAVKREDAEDYESRIADELRDMNPYSWEGYVRPLRERHKRICAALAADGTATGAGGEG